MKKTYEFCKMVLHHWLNGLVFGLIAAIVLIVATPVIAFVIGHICLAILAVGMAFGEYDLGGIGMVGALTFIIDIFVIPFTIPIALWVVNVVFEHIPMKEQEAS